jgi:hypothetical protein
MRGGKRPGRRRGEAIRDYPLWLVATVTLGLLALPWVIALALAPHHDLNVGILAAVSVPLSGLWLTWVTVAQGGGSILD